MGQELETDRQWKSDENYLVLRSKRYYSPKLFSDKSCLSLKLLRVSTLVRPIQPFTSRCSTRLSGSPDVPVFLG